MSVDDAERLADMADRQRIKNESKDIAVRSVERALEGGELSNHQIAARCGVGLTFIQDVKRRLALKSKEGGDGERTAQPAPVASEVDCLVAGTKIGARRCIDAQAEQRCWCSKAPLAVLAVMPTVLKGNRLEGILETCKATAQAMLKRSSPDRYDGPALRKVRGLPDPVEIPLPTPKGYTPAEEEEDDEPVTRAVRVATSVAAAPRAAPEVDAREDAREAAIQEHENTNPRAAPVRIERRDPEPGDAYRATVREVALELRSKGLGFDAIASKLTREGLRPRPGATFTGQEVVELLGDSPAATPPAASGSSCCEFPGCKKALRVNNLSHLCQAHRNKVPSRDRAGLVPVAARAAGSAGAALDAGAEIVPNPARNEAATEGGVLPKSARKCCHCHGWVERRNKSGFCAKSPCQTALSEEKAKTMPRCATPGCGRPAFKAKLCGNCSGGTRPGSGFEDCETPGCSKQVQRFRGETKCSLCRRGLTHHITKEKYMGKASPLDGVKDAAFRKAYEDAAGNLAAVANSFDVAWATAAKRCKAMGLTVHKRGRNRVPILEAAPIVTPDPLVRVSATTDLPTVVDGLDIREMTWDQLIAGTRELHRRLQERDVKVREAELALANEPPLSAA